MSHTEPRLDWFWYWTNTWLDLDWFWCRHIDMHTHAWKQPLVSPSSLGTGCFSFSVTLSVSVFTSSAQRSSESSELMKVAAVQVRTCCPAVVRETWRLSPSSLQSEAELLQDSEKLSAPLHRLSSGCSSLHDWILLTQQRIFRHSLYFGVLFWQDFIIWHLFDLFKPFYPVFDVWTFFVQHIGNKWSDLLCCVEEWRESDLRVLLPEVGGASEK